MAQLFVNVDHIATLRQARGTKDPDPVHAAAIIESAGGHGISAFMSNSRKHIQDRDVYVLKQTVLTKFNLIMGLSQENIKIALDICPSMVTLVPEQQPQERVFESGIKIQGKEKELSKALEPFQENNIIVSLYLDPDIQTIRTAARIGVNHVEIHCGYYAAASGKSQQDEFARINDTVVACQRLGISVSLGHGLTYQNIQPFTGMADITIFHIGFSIISRGLMVGMHQAVTTMLGLISSRYKA